MTGITAMDFELPEELKLLKRTVRTFVDRELIPIEMNAMDGPALRTDVRADLERKAKDLGLWLLDVPTEYGGQGLSLLGMAVVWEEICRTIALPPRGPVVFGPDVKPVLFSSMRHRRKNIFFRSCAARRRRPSRNRSPMPAPIPAPCARRPCARATTTSSTATNGGSPRRRTPIFCNWSPPLTARRAAAAA